MKKVLSALLLAGFAVHCMGEMDSKVFDPGTLTPGQVATNKIAIRGQLESIKVLTGKVLDTTTVVIAYGGRTIFTATKNVGTNWYQPRIAVHGQTGTALTWVGNDGPTGTNALYGKIPLAGDVTCTVTSESIITTNSLSEVELIFSK